MMNASRANRLIGVLLVAAVVAAPFGVSAASSSVFCATLNERSNASMQMLDARIAQLDSLRNQEESVLSSKRFALDTEKAQVRTVASEERSAKYSELESKSVTEAQKSAILNFTSSVESATSARKASVDAAVSAYRNGIDQLRTAHQQGIDAMISSLTAARQAAFEQAQSDCVAGVPSVTAKARFRSRVAAAKAAAKAAPDTDSVKAQVAALASTERSDIATATTVFKNSVLVAQATLKAALATK